MLKDLGSLEQQVWHSIFACDEFSVEIIIDDFDVLFVTFDNWEAQPPENSRFAERYVRKSGFSQLHFSCKGNDWWQYTGLTGLCDELGEILSRIFRDRIGYGSSMGAYGALLFSSRLQLTKVIALSPQFSIDREKVPFERRWANEAERISFLCDDMWHQVNSSANILLVYDPEDDDSKHIDLFPHQSKMMRIRLTGAGHPVGVALKQSGMLARLMDEALTESFSFHKFEQDFSAAINDTPQFYYVRSRQLFDRGEIEESLGYADRAIELSGPSFSYFRMKGKCHFLLGEYAAALEAFNLAASIRSNDDIKALALRSAVGTGDFNCLAATVSRYGKGQGNDSFAQLLVKEIIRKNKVLTINSQ